MPANVVRCKKAGCSGSCLGEVVAAGWAGIRPGGTRTCRTCGTRFDRPAAGDSTVLLELYKTKWNTKEELKDKGVKPKPVFRQPLQGKQVGAAATTPKDKPWGPTKQVAELQRKLDEANAKLAAVPGESSKGDSSALQPAKKDEQEQKLRDRLVKVKKWLKEADSQKDTDRFQEELDEAEQALKAHREQKDASKPWHQQAKEAENAHKAAKQALDTAQAKLASTRAALEQLQKEQDEEVKKVEELQQKCNEAEAKAKRLTAAGSSLAPPPTPGPFHTQHSTTAECLQQVLAQLDKELASQPPAEEVQTKIKATFDLAFAGLQRQQQQHQPQQAGEGSKATGAEEAEPAEQQVAVEDVEMDDTECDQYMRDFFGEEALEGLNPEEMAAKRTKFRAAGKGLVKAATLKAKKQTKKGGKAAGAASQGK